MIKNEKEACGELLQALDKASKSRYDNIFSIGRDIVMSLQANESIMELVTSNTIVAFNQLKVQYLEKYSTDDYIVFFNIKEDKAVINGEEKIVAYMYDQNTNRIVVTFVD